MLNPDIRLFDHQRQATDFALENNGCCALFMEIGTGKTLTALSIFSQLRKYTENLKLLVVCPISLIDAAWAEDIDKFTTFTHSSLRDKKFKPADIYIVNFEMLRTQRGDNLVNGLLKTGRFMIVIDESSKIKSYRSQITKKLLSNRYDYKHRIVMSGSPAPNDETEYWPQITFVRDGTFPRSFFAFRNYYFHLARNGQKLASGAIINKQIAQKIFQQGFKYELSSEKRKELAERMNPCCFWAKKKDCLDLPDQVDEIRRIEFSPEQEKIYKSMKNDLVAEIQNKSIAAPVALTKVMKLREICSCFLMDEKGQKFTIPNNPKLKELSNLIEEIGKEQAIIWCEFQHEVEEIKAILGDRAVTLYGATTDKNEPIQAFKSGQAQFIIANSQSMAHGVTLTNCSIQIFYALSYSYERYEQCRGRTHRFGQTNKCVYVHLLMDKSIEISILKVLRRKGRAQEILDDFLCNLKKI